MPRELIGAPEGGALRFGIVVSRFNRSITAPLLAGALEALATHGVHDDDIVVAHVPGAFEIPFAAQALARSGRYQALVCLGAVVRGETPHFDYICGEVARGVGRVVAEYRIPAAFGVLTTDTIEQALARAGEGHGNKGYEAAVTAIEMAQLARLLG
ncbi:MAG: 6,7-dimethyl-8-ribityllumazine synthase [Deltaproteobacteria bacterium]|nr:6,7-dimethyl-8-ribityllumazine synthase [Deltaproteobacteria bacterium]